MALYKRSKSAYWWMRVTVNGREIRRSTGTADKKLAQEFEAQLTAERWRTARLGERPRYRWEQAVERWLTERAHLSSVQDQKLHLRWLHQHFLVARSFPTAACCSRSRTAPPPRR